MTISKNSKARIMNVNVLNQASPSALNLTSALGFGCSV